MIAFDSKPYYKKVQPHITGIKKKSYDHIISNDRNREYSLPRHSLDSPKVFQKLGYEGDQEKEGEGIECPHSHSRAPSKYPKRNKVPLVVNTIYREEFDEMEGEFK